MCLILCDPIDYTVHGILQARMLEWVNTGRSPGDLPTQGLNPGLLHCRWILYQLSHKGSPRILGVFLDCVAYPFSSESFWATNRPRSPPLQVDSLQTELPGNWLAAFNKIFYILTLLISNAYLPLGYVKQVTIWVAIFYSRLCAQLILKQQWIEMGGSTYRRIYFSSRYNIIHGWLNPQMWSLQIRGNLQVRSNLHVGRNLCVLGMCTCVLSQQVKINVDFPLIG